MIVEFAAIPGSGKTYISNKMKTYLETHLDSSAFVVYTRDDLVNLMSSTRKNALQSKLHTLMLFLRVADLSIFRQFYYLLHLTGDLDNNLKYAKYYLRSLLLYTFINDLSKKDERTPIFLVDEGFLQCSSLFLHKHHSADTLEDYFSHISEIDTIDYYSFPIVHVFIDSHWELNSSRLDNRAKGWPGTFRNLRYEEKKEALHQRSKYYQTLKAYAKGHFNYVHEMDNSDFDLNTTESLFPDILNRIHTEFSGFKNPERPAS